MKPIFVTGASGNIGREVVSHLRQRGIPTRLGARPGFAAKACDAWNRVDFDYQESDTCRRAVTGCDALRGTTLEVRAGAKPQLANLDAEREAIDAQAARAAAAGQVPLRAYRLRAITGVG